MLKVDALDLLQKAVHKVLARLLAVAHDVQPGVFLRLDPEQRGISLGLLQLSPLSTPLRPEFLGFRQPGRFGQAASDGGGEHADLLGLGMGSPIERTENPIINLQPWSAPLVPGLAFREQVDGALHQSHHGLVKHG